MNFTINYLNPTLEQGLELEQQFRQTLRQQSLIVIVNSIQALLECPNVEKIIFQVDKSYLNEKFDLYVHLRSALLTPTQFDALSSQMLKNKNYSEKDIKILKELCLKNQFILNKFAMIGRGISRKSELAFLKDYISPVYIKTTYDISQLFEKMYHNNYISYNPAYPQNELTKDNFEIFKKNFLGIELYQDVQQALLRDRVEKEKNNLQSNIEWGHSVALKRDKI